MNDSGQTMIVQQLYRFLLWISFHTNKCPGVSHQPGYIDSARLTPFRALKTCHEKEMYGQDLSEWYIPIRTFDLQGSEKKKIIISSYIPNCYEPKIFFNIFSKPTRMHKYWLLPAERYIIYDFAWSIKYLGVLIGFAWKM